MIKIEMDRNDILAVKSALSGIKNGFPRAMARSLNRTIIPARNEAVNLIIKALTGKTKKIIRNAFVIEKASWRHLYASVAAIVEGPKGRIPLYWFRTRKVAGGVRVKVMRDGPMIMLKHAFYAIMPAGWLTHKGIFWRATDKVGTGTLKKPLPGYFASLGKDDRRLPIKELFGPTAASIFESEKRIGAVMKHGSDKLFDSLEHEVDYLLGRL